MILIVEGNEGTGKTTLINSLMNRLRMTSIKTSRKFEDLFQLYEFMSKSEALYVLDRSFITDIVYRRIDHQKGDLKLYKIGKLLGDNESRIKVIFCHNDKAFENAMKRGENNITVKAVHKIIDDTFYCVEEMIKNFTDIEVFDYNYEYQSVDDVIKFIKGDV